MQGFSHELISMSPCLAPEQTNMSSPDAVDHRASRGTGEWDTAEEEDEDHGQEQHKNVNSACTVFMEM